MFRLIDIYRDIYGKPEDWSAREKFDRPATVEELFGGEENRAYRFIHEYLDRAGKGIIIDAARDYRINELNAAHTISAFYLGIYLKKTLGLSMRNLPAVYGDEDENFSYFWMLSCLCHDAAKVIEEQEFTQEIHDIHDFCDKYHLRECFADVSADALLFQQYFKYRLGKERIDHGIAGACLLYGEMMRQYRMAQQYGSIRNHCYELNGLRFSPQFASNMLLAANTIAHHNLWRVDPCSENPEDREQTAAYRELGIGKWLCCRRGKNRISLKGKQTYTNSQGQLNKELLFLLSLTDSLEPIKAARTMQEKGWLSSFDFLDVLNTVKINLPFRGIIKIDCGQFFKGYQTRLAGEEEFLSVLCELNEEKGKASIEITR